MQLIIIAIAIVCTAALFSALKDRFEDKTKEYFYITKRHLDGDVLPSPGAKVYFHDNQKVSIEGTVYTGSSYTFNRPNYSGKVLGPAVLLESGSLLNPTQFWLSVKSINGIEVVLPASLENK